MDGWRSPTTAYAVVAFALAGCGNLSRSVHVVPAFTETAAALIHPMSPSQSMRVGLPSSAARPRSLALFNHLYVANSVGGSSIVTEYLLTKGIPGSMPDNTLSPVTDVDTIRVGPRGFLYVSGAGPAQFHTGLYPPGASGTDRSIRNVYAMPNMPMYNIAIGGDRFLYVGDNGTQVFRPSARGTPVPVQVIAGSDPIGIDSSGDLIADIGSGVGVFANPTIHPTLVRSFCADMRVSLVQFVSDPDGTVFIPRLGYVDAYSPTSAGCPAWPPPTRIESTTIPMANVLAVAVSNGFAYALDSDNPRLDGPAIFVFDASRGAQKPLAIVSGPSTQLNGPHAAAVGP